MVEFTGYGHILARESVRFNCFCSLIISLEGDLEKCFEGLDRLHERTLFLNDDDEQRPQIVVRKRLRTVYLELVFYERDFGERQSDTDDYDEEIVARAAGDLFVNGYCAAIEKIEISESEKENRKREVRAILAKFVESFDPRQSPVFGPQPKRNRQKFWITPPLGVDPTAFRHD